MNKHEMVADLRLNVTGVYKIVCKKNGKVYVGSSTKCLRSRRMQHISALRKGTHFSTSLQADYDCHGESEFEFVVIHRLPVEACRKTETAEIKLHNAANPEGGYNQDAGRPTRFTSRMVSLTFRVPEEVKRKLKSEGGAGVAIVELVCERWPEIAEIL